MTPFLTHTFVGFGYRIDDERRPAGEPEIIAGSFAVRDYFVELDNGEGQRWLVAGEEADRIETA